MAKLFTKKLNKRGFTLAELLIVVAILAILIAVAIPIYTSAMQEAQKKVNMSNERSLRGAATMDILMHWNDPSGDLKSGTAGEPNAVYYKFSEGAESSRGWYAWADFSSDGTMGTVHVGVGSMTTGKTGVASYSTLPTDKSGVENLTFETTQATYGTVTNPNIIAINLSSTTITH